MPRWENIIFLAFGIKWADTPRGSPGASEAFNNGQEFTFILTLNGFKRGKIYLGEVSLINMARQSLYYRTERELQLEDLEIMIESIIMIMDMSGYTLIMQISGTNWGQL